MITFIENGTEGIEPTESELVPALSLDAIPEPGDQELAAAAAEPETVVPVAVATPAAADPDEEPAEVVDEESLDVEDSTRLYLREIARVPLLSAEEEVVLAKSIELGVRMATEPWTAILDIHEWTLNDTEAKTRAKNPAYLLPFADEAHRIVLAAFADDGALDLLIDRAEGRPDRRDRVGRRRGARAPRARPATSARSTTSSSTRRRSSRSSTGSTATAAGRSSVTRSRSWRCAPGPATRSRSRRSAAGSRPATTSRRSPR